MRTGGCRAEERASALWGSKRDNGSRGNALWGSKRRTALLTTLALAFVLPLGAAAGVGSGKTVNDSFVTPSLLDAARAHSGDTFAVIVQGKAGNQAAHALADLAGDKKGVRGLRSIDGLAVQLTGAQILTLAVDKRVNAITPDAPMRLSANSSNEKWPYVTGLMKYWSNGVSPAAPAATIAIVDSGIEASRPEFGGRVVANVNLTSLPGNSAGDGRGHGTFVAGIAAGDLLGHTGAAPGAKIVSLDVMDDQGMARTSDVIAAADWILANKSKYGIRVANFSLHSSVANSFMYDPLDKAVERLWFNGVVVVTAAGNYGYPDRPSGVPFAPGNDPFVITVGASDTGRSVSTNDDFAAPWSAYGYTLDGFAKPDVAAPGRYMVGPVSTTATLTLERPTNVVAPGYMQLSGTSFAAPVVAGAAAQILAAHPSWTPDQVKGALMLTAKPAAGAAPLSVGVGVVDVAKAVALTSAPNPNAALNAFLVPDQAGGSMPVFDAASWASTALANASWASASWSSASWASASWSSASWASASWASASWASASWSSASW